MDARLDYLAYPGTYLRCGNPKCLYYGWIFRVPPDSHSVKMIPMEVKRPDGAAGIPPAPTVGFGDAAFTYEGHTFHTTTTAGESGEFTCWIGAGILHPRLGFYQNWNPDRN